MKVLFFSDVHFKYMSSFPYFNKVVNHGYTYELERALKSIDFVIRTVEKENPDLVVCLGDIFHSLRTSQNIVIAHAVLKMNELYEVIKSINSEFIIVNGNHDYINNNISMIDMINADYKVKSPESVGEFFIYPFIEPEEDMNRELTRIINSNKYKYVLAHTSINGFYYNKVKQIENGVIVVDSDTQVISGHIHIKQANNNVYYVGSLYQNNFSEYSKLGNGVVLFDTDSGVFRSIENDSCGYLKTFYLSYINDKFEEQLDRCEGVKIVIDVDIDSDDLYREIYNNVIDMLNRYNIKFIVNKICTKDMNKIINTSNITSTTDIMKLYIEKKYSDLLDVYKKYVGGVS